MLDFNNSIFRPPEPKSFGLRGIAMGVHGAQRLKPDDHGLVSTLIGPKVSMQGEYRILVKRQGQVIRDTGWFKNLIVDQGLNYLGNNAGGAVITQYCHIGTGTSAPEPTQTSLDSFAFASAAYVQNIPVLHAGAPTYTNTITGSYNFAQGTTVGVFTEVGISKQNTNGALFSRALITDLTGNPVSITVTALDQLSVFYAVTMTPITTPQAGVVTLGGVDYSFTAYMTALGSFGDPASLPTSMFAPNSTSFPFFGLTNGNTGVAATIIAAAGTPLSPTVLTDTTIPSATQLATISQSASGLQCSSTYTANQFKQTSVITFPPTVGNLTGGIQSMMIGFQGRNSSTTILTGFNTLFYFSSVIPKTNTQILSLTFQTSWST